MYRYLMTASALLAIAASGCASRRTATPDSATELTPLVRESRMVSPAAMPKARIYRTSGDYADNVPVQIRPSGQLLSYPAPTDLTDDSTPVPLIDGWLLDRCGVSLDTRFTSYSFAVYRRLTAPPTPAQVMANLIPGARVTEVEILPMTTSEAAADTRAVIEIIRANRLKVQVDTTAAPAG